MNWEEIVERQSKDYKEHINGYKQSKDQLEADKALLMQHFKCAKETELPDPIQEKLARDQVAWQNEWGMYGSRFKAMRISQQKEIDKFFRQGEVVQSIDNNRSKEKGKGAER